jgi:hypothetical protein
VAVGRFLVVGNRIICPPLLGRARCIKVLFKNKKALEGSWMALLPYDDRT